MDHECCTECITGRPKATRRRRNTIWVCPTCSQAWVLRRAYSWGESFDSWERWPPPGPQPPSESAEQADSAATTKTIVPPPPGVPFVVTEAGPEPLVGPPLPPDFLVEYLAGILSGIPPLTMEHPFECIPHARRVLNALDDLGYRVVRVR